MGGALRVLVGVTGGIAAYKVPLLVRLLRKSGCEVKAVLTPAAKTLVGMDALRTLSGNPVYSDGEFRHDMDHIRLSEWADVFAVCPATANTLAKMACGIADNLLTTLALSIPADKIIAAPAMNRVMWMSKATQANINTLKDRGIDILPVEDGELACGVSGPGRMAGIEVIARRVLSRDRVDAPVSNTSGDVNCIAGTSVGNMPVDSAARHKSAGHQPAAVSSIGADVFRGKRVLISSGPTEEPIDPVRVITNRSSGKMGAALARVARDMGASVIVVSGPASEPLPIGIDAVPVRTAAEMEQAVLHRFDTADVCIMAAAVSDYRPVSASKSKLHRSEGEKMTLELTPNPDILAGLGAAKRPGQFLVGFSLESGEDVDRAEAKMRKKNCDLMVFNRAASALGGDSTEFTLLFGDGRRESYPAMDKSEAALIILEMARFMMGGK